MSLKHRLSLHGGMAANQSFGSESGTSANLSNPDIPLSLNSARGGGVLAEEVSRRFLAHPLVIWLLVVSAAFVVETAFRGRTEAIANIPFRAIAVAVTIFWTRRSARSRMADH